MPTPTWEVRPYEPGDEEGLVSLYRRVFGRDRSVEHWRWKLMPQGRAPEHVWVAEDQPTGQIVGQYAGIPLQLKLGARILPAIHAVEAMTHPEFRRQGMFTALGSRAHEAWAAAGVPIVIGLPNDQWGSRRDALGYIPLFPMAWLRLPLHLERVAARNKALPPAARRVLAGLGSAASSALRVAVKARLQAGTRRSRLQGVRVVEGSDLIDRLWSNVSPRLTNSVVRSGPWVIWRFAKSEPQEHTVLAVCENREPIGYIAYYVRRADGRRTGVIADLFTRPGDRAAASSLLSRALTDLSARGVGSVLLVAAPGSQPYRLLRSAGFLPAGSFSTFTFDVVPLDSSLDPAQLSNPGDWYLTGGDFDIV